MYITLLDPEIKIAKGDIICYKVMEKRDKTLISPYQNMPYECGTMYVSETPMIVKYGSGLINVAYVEDGFRSFFNKEEAECFKSALQIWISKNAVDKYVAVKCLIPAGTRYAAGFFYDVGRCFSSFCSERIIAVEEV